MTDFTVTLGAPVAPFTAQKPDGRPLSGRFVALEKLTAAAHGDALWSCAREEPADRWAYLGGAGPFGPGDEAAFRDLVAAHEASADPYFYAVRPLDADGAPGPAQGWASLMRHDIPNGVIEVGWIWLSAKMNGTPASTEAMYMLMRCAFEDLSMRRYEWKCNALNAPSRKTAARLGFVYEGTFRQHQVNRDRNRDTAWFSILDVEWPRAKAAFEAWLSPENFDAEGRQKRRLEDIRDGL